MCLISCALSSFLEPSELCGDTFQQELALHDTLHQKMDPFPRAWQSLLSLTPPAPCVRRGSTA